MSIEQETVFTAEQMLAMVETGKTLDVVDEATRDYIVQYDPSQETHPNLVSMDISPTGR